MKVILKKYGVRKKIAVVPNPVDLQKFKKTTRGFLHNRFDLGLDKIILLTACRLGKEKNIDFLIKAFKQVSKSNSQAQLVIVGDGPEKKVLENLVTKLSLEGRVTFTGFIESEQMPAVYSDSDIFLFASTSETQGMVVPEAAACGLPLVVVRDQAYSGAIEEGVNGFETAARLNAFAQKVLFLINNPDKRIEFGLASEKLIGKNFNPEVIIKKLLAVYQEALEIRENEPRVSRQLQNRFKNFVGWFRYVRDLNRRLFS